MRNPMSLYPFVPRGAIRRSRVILGRSVLAALPTLLLTMVLPACLGAGSDPGDDGGATNLLVIIGDDHRGGTLGIDGDPRQATPNLDRLARGDPV